MELEIKIFSLSNSPPLPLRLRASLPLRLRASDSFRAPNTFGLVGRASGGEPHLFVDVAPGGAAASGDEPPSNVALRRRARAPRNCPRQAMHGWPASLGCEEPAGSVVSCCGQWGSAICLLAGSGASWVPDAGVHPGFVGVCRRRSVLDPHTRRNLSLLFRDRGCESECSIWTAHTAQ